MDRFYSTLSLSMRARKLIYGFDTVKENILKQKVFLLVTALDLSPKTAKEVKFLSDKYSVPFFMLDKTMEEIGNLLGKKTGVIGIIDEGFAKKLDSLYNETEETV